MKGRAAFYDQLLPSYENVRKRFQKIFYHKTRPPKNTKDRFSSTRIKRIFNESQKNTFTVY